MILSNCGSMPYREAPVLQRQLVNEQHYNLHLDLARTIHKCTRALVCPLFPQAIFLSRSDPLVRHFFGKSPDIATDGVYAGIAGANSCEKKSCAIITVIPKLSGLDHFESQFDPLSVDPEFPV